MMNQRLSLETNPNPIIEDTAVHPINPTQEEIPHSLEGPSQDEAHEEAVYMEPTVDVGLPPSNYQEESEGQQVSTKMPKCIVDALNDRNPTPLPLLESTHRRTSKRIQVDEGILNSIEGTLS